MDTEAISSIAALGALAVMVVIGLPIYLGVRHAGRVREFEHAERMKALEMGQLLPGDQSWWTPMRLCALIGAGVPIGVFSLAMIATNLDSFSHDDTIWTAAGMLGMTSVICGTRTSVSNRSFRTVTVRKA